MENSNFDETLPTQINPEDAEPSVSGEPQPVSSDPETMGASNLDQTIPTLIMAEDQDATGFEDTIPPPNDQVNTMTGDSGEEPPVSPDETSQIPKRPSWRIWALVGFLAFILLAFSSAFLGYRSGINQRQGAEAAQASQLAAEQYHLALQDMEARNYYRARQRFEYVISIDPNFPGATEGLANALLYQNATATPTIAPTPTVSPTPDLRGVEELYTQAQQELVNSDWNAAIETLLTLRKADIEYQVVWVDNMLYISFRNRGADKILKDGDLEGGIYDLTLAEQFGPLDADANSYLTWAGLYITGASFWELDWAQAVYYFEQVGPALPNLRDGSGWTAAERYRLALIGYGGFLADQDEWCSALEQYQLALTFGSDPELEEAIDKADEECRPKSEKEDTPDEDTGGEPTATPVPDSGPTATKPAPTEPSPTELPPKEPSPTEPPPPEPSPTPEA
jgi:hypothetical protein